MSKRNHDNVEIHSIAREAAYSGFFKVGRYTLSHGKFNGEPTEMLVREVFERGNSVAVLPYDAKLDRVMMIRQFLIGSHLAGQANRPLQVIAGRVEDGETGLDVARREAQEEAGCDIGWTRPAHTFLPSPGGSSERIETFVAQADLSGQLGDRGIHGLAEESEDIRAEVYTAQDAIALLDSGAIEAGPAVVLLSWFARHHEKLRADWLSSSAE